MTRNPFEISLGNPFEEPTQKKKRVKITPAQRNYIWEHPKKYGRTCSICGEKITKPSELAFDHTKAFSKGGVKQALAHDSCNKMKHSGSLGKIQKALGIKTTKRRATKRKRKRTRESNLLNFNFKPTKIPNPFKF